MIEIKLPPVDTTEGSQLVYSHLIPSPQKILYFFFGCRADGGPALIVRFAAVWATVGQRFRLKAVMADIAKVVVQALFTSIMACLSWK